MPSKRGTVVVVDDDRQIRGFIKMVLELEGFRVLTAADGESALAVFETESPDLMLLDIMMPGMDGYTVCRRVRQFSQLPIIMVTALGDDAKVVAGLEAGADDYVVKPVSAAQLVARVEAVLRRSTPPQKQLEPTFRSDDLVVDFAQRKVTVSGQEVNLTATEYRLLSFLAQSAGREVTPDEVLEAVWGDDYTGESHILRANIGRLRRKLGKLRDTWPTGLRREDWIT